MEGGWWVPIHFVCESLVRCFRVFCFSNPCMFSQSRQKMRNERLCSIEPRPAKEPVARVQTVV